MFMSNLEICYSVDNNKNKKNSHTGMKTSIHDPLFPDILIKHCFKVVGSVTITLYWHFYVGVGLSDDTMVQSFPSEAGDTVPDR